MTEDDVRLWVSRVERDLQDTRQLLDDAIASGGGTVDAAEEPIPPMYDNVEQWVAERFAPVFARSVGARARWCPMWWDHGEAVLRLEALWRSWEVHRLDPRRGIATWLRDFLDGQLAALLDDDGTFRSCTPEEHTPQPSLPLTPAPAGWWDRADGHS